MLFRNLQVGIKQNPTSKQYLHCSIYIILTCFEWRCQSNNYCLKIVFSNMYESKWRKSKLKLIHDNDFITCNIWNISISFKCFTLSKYTPIFTWQTGVIQFDISIYTFAFIFTATHWIWIHLFALSSVGTIFSQVLFWGQNVV